MGLRCSVDRAHAVAITRKASRGRQLEKEKASAKVTPLGRDLALDHDIEILNEFSNVIPLYLEGLPITCGNSLS